MDEERAGSDGLEGVGLTVSFAGCIYFTEYLSDFMLTEYLEDLIARSGNRVDPE